MKNVCKIALMAIMMVTFSIAAQAKDNDGKKQRMTREQMAEAQAKHIANEIALDDATTQKFVEAFTAQQKEVWTLFPKNKDKKKKTDMTDAEAEKCIKDHFDQTQKILDIRKEYYQKYSKFLTQKQIMRVYEMEKKSMRNLAKHNRHKKDFRPGFKPGERTNKKK